MSNLSKSWSSIDEGVFVGDLKDIKQTLSSLSCLLCQEYVLNNFAVYRDNFMVFGLINGYLRSLYDVFTTSKLEALNLRNHGYHVSIKEDGANAHYLRWNLFRAIGSPITDAQKLQRIRDCGSSGVKRIHSDGTETAETFRCSSPACPYCGRYDRRMKANERAAILNTVLGSTFFRNVYKQADQEPALLHVALSLPQEVTKRMHVHLVSLISAPNKTKGLEAATHYLNSLSKALKHAADEFLSEFFWPPTVARPSRRFKAQRTLWLQVDTHLIKSKNLFMLEPHVHAVSPGFFGEPGDLKTIGGQGASGIHILPTWPRVDRSRLQEGRRRWRDVVLRQLKNCGVYDCTVDEPAEFVIHLIPIDSPSEERITNLTRYTHSGHWKNIDNQLIAVAVPTKPTNGPSYLWIRRHKDRHDLKTHNGLPIRFEWVERVEMNEHNRLFLQTILGLHGRVLTAQTFGGWRGKFLTRSSRSHTTDANEEVQPPTKVPIQIRTALEYKRPRGGRQYWGYQNQHRIKDPQTGQWGEWQPSPSKGARSDDDK